MQEPTAKCHLVNPVEMMRKETSQCVRTLAVPSSNQVENMDQIVPFLSWPELWLRYYYFKEWGGDGWIDFRSSLLILGVGCCIRGMPIYLPTSSLCYLEDSWGGTESVLYYQPLPVVLAQKNKKTNNNIRQATCHQSNPTTVDPKLVD